MATRWVIFGSLFLSFFVSIIYFKPASQQIDLSSESYEGKPRSAISTFANRNVAEFTDSFTPECVEPVLAGLKCLNTSVKTAEGLVYKIQIKWTRPNMESKGSVLMMIGGSGAGDIRPDGLREQSRMDPPTQFALKKLSDEDQLRVIEVDFVDAPLGSNPWGGYFVHSGGYKSAGYAFMAVVSLLIEKQIVRGNFLNYLGGSNASVVAAYALSHLGMDRFFDRVVFQMGPFMTSLQNSCDPNAEDSFYKNEIALRNYVFELFGWWRYGSNARNVCDNVSDDRLSVLGHIRNFPNTHVHVIVGALEEQFGFGKYLLNSNEAWYKAISAKSKSRIIRPEMAHNNSYKDMRRYLKLSPDESPAEGEDPDYKDSEGEFCGGGQIVKFNCRASAQVLPPTVDKNVKWADQGKGCFHLATGVKCQ